MAAVVSRTIGVFATDSETVAIAEFELPVSIEEIRRTLGVSKGGLRKKNGSAYVSNLQPGGEYVFAGGPKFTVYVTMLGVNAAINVKSAKAKVSSLQKDILEHFDPLVTAPDGGELRIAEMKSGGILLNSNHTIESALADGATIECVEFSSWMKTIIKTLDYAKATCTQSEFEEDEWDKWVEIGPIKGSPKFYVSIGKGYGDKRHFYRLEILEPANMSNFPKDGKVLLAYAEGKTKSELKWVCEANAVVEKGVAVAVELSCRAASSSVSNVKRVELKMEGKKMEIGKVNITSSDNTVRDHSKRELPKTEIVGPTLDKIEGVPPKDAVVPTQQPSTGPLPFTVVVEEVVPEMCAANRSDAKAWYQLYYIATKFTNPSPADITIAKIKVEIFKDNAWVASPESEVVAGARDGRLHYKWDWNSKGKFYVPAEDTRDVCFRASFEMPLTLPFIHQRRRTHNSYPQPLKFKLTFIAVDGTSNNIEFEQMNGPLELITKADKLKDNGGKELLFWFPIDDTIVESRSCAYIKQIGQSNDWDYLDVNVRITGNEKCKYLYASELMKAQYKAKKQGVLEIPVEEFSNDGKDKGIKFDCFIMLDPKEFYAYALKFAFKTNSGHGTSYYPLPFLKGKGDV